ncbi:MAG: hypothetical protein AAF447_12125 [Myxococcota bacterium]
MSRRLLGLGALVATGLALVAWFLPGDEREAELVEEVRGPAGPRDRAAAPGTAARARRVPERRRERPRPGRMLDEAPFPRSPRGTVSAIESYLARTIYPPESQPLDPARHAERIEWNTRRDAARRVPDDPEVSVLYTADVYTVFGSAPVRSRLRVQRDGEPIDVTVLEAVARIEASDLAEVPAPVALRYEPSEEEPGELWNTFAPDEAFPGVETSVRLRMDLTFTEGESAPRRVNLDFAWSPGTSGRFTGAFRESLESGSLVVYAEVEIDAPGLYNIDANLWDSEDQPVAFARFKDELPVGTQEIPLRFFGAVLAESRSVPPFELRQLHGARYTLGRTPPQLPMTPYEGVYRTADYDLERFSTDEWMDERRQRTVERLRRDEGLGRLAPPVPEDAHLASLPRHGRGHLPPSLEGYEGSPGASPPPPPPPGSGPPPPPGASPQRTAP